MISTATIEPGLHLDVPNEVYHSWPGVSKSMLDQLDETPAHLWDYINQEEHKQTAAMALGSAVHCAVLEPDQFDKRYAVMPEVDGRTKEAKVFKAEIEKKGKKALTTIDARWIKAIAKRVHENPHIETWLNYSDSLIEASIVWEMDGYICRMRSDLISPGSRLIVDLKTTICGMDRFPAEVFRRNYHRQAYWYLKGAENIGIDCDRFIIVAAHKSRPFLVSLHEIHRDSEAFAIAADECEALFDTYKNCMRTGQWPGYPEDPIPVQVVQQQRDVPEPLVEEPFT